MHLEGAVAGPGGADVAELRWSNDGVQTLGADDLPGLFAALCSDVKKTPGDCAEPMHA